MVCAGSLVSDLASLKIEIERALLTDSGDAAVVAVCTACAKALPGDGAAITVMTSDARRETVFATDDVIAALEHAQYNVGEGPSLLAFSTGRPVLVPDIEEAPAAGRWPGLMHAVRGRAMRGIFCFPMRFGVINIGVCACYRREAGLLSSKDVSFVLQAIDLTSLALLELREGQHAESLLGRWLAADGTQRRQVHQATGMLIVQLGVSAEVAFARLRGYAFAQGIDIEQVADDVVNRRLRLDPDPQVLRG